MHLQQKIGTCYQIDGFRSLLKFSLVLKPGLNVFVGPNGSGKTNFIEFLDFLDFTIRSNASTAVSRGGGVSRVFSQEQAKKRTPVLRARISGTADLEDSRRQPDPDGFRWFRFDYDIEIKFDRAESLIFISKEEVRFYKLYRDGEGLADSFVGALGVIRRSASEEAPPKWAIGNRLQTENKRNPLQVKSKYVFSSKTKLPPLARIEGISIAPDESMIIGVRNFPALEAIRAAITKGRSINIDPAKAREPDNLVNPPGIGRDGSGLSTTLHHLLRLKKSPNSIALGRLRDATSGTIDTIVEWTKLVFPQLASISVLPDPHSGKFLGYLDLGDNASMRIPFQMASDGTLKWLSLITLVCTSGSTLTIEEPENFLHPRMQQMLIQLFRDVLERTKSGDHFIITTHSETLINQCRPEELLIFSFDHLATTCHPVKNPERIREEINRTGFGLGYYFANNAIS